MVVARGRFLEGQKADALFSDPYAEHLFPSDLAEIAGIENSEQLVNLVAVRTRRIDDAILTALAPPNSFRQVVVLGAGLDTRAWRLSGSAGASACSYYEVDFAEIFDFKLPRLAEAGAKIGATFRYVPVSVDLSLPDWHARLTEHGFDPLLKTFWLLEGLTGYLSETENIALFGAVTALSAPDSRLVATFLTSKTTVQTPMHRFKPDDAIAFIYNNFPGRWAGESVPIEESFAQFARPVPTEGFGFRGYCIVDVQAT